MSVYDVAAVDRLSSLRRRREGGDDVPSATRPQQRRTPLATVPPSPSLDRWSIISLIHTFNVADGLTHSASRWPGTRYAHRPMKAAVAQSYAISRHQLTRAFLRHLHHFCTWRLLGLIAGLAVTTRLTELLKQRRHTQVYIACGGIVDYIPRYT